MTGEGFEVGLEPDDEQQHCDTEITERPDEVEIGNSGHPSTKPAARKSTSGGRRICRTSPEAAYGYRPVFRADPRARGRGIAGEPVRDLEVPPARGCGEEDDAGPRERD